MSLEYRVLRHVIAFYNEVLALWLAVWQGCLEGGPGGRAASMA